MKTKSFREKAVIVTGASSGIGQALSLQLADQGAWLVLAARNTQRLELLTKECQNRGGRAITAVTDVADESQCKALVQHAHSSYGRIDVLFNNAGIDVVSKLEDLPDLRLFKQVMDVNFYGAVHCTYYALPFLKETHGRIVNISSLGGVLAIPYNTSYIASKFAMVGFSDSLRMETEKQGISVTVIFPSLVETEFHERYLDNVGHPKGPSGRNIYTKRTMSADKCAQIIIKAAKQRKRQVLMWPGTLCMVINFVAPGLLDKLIISTFLRPAVKRVSHSQQD